MTVKNPDADASEWHAQKARSGTPRTQGVSPLTRPASLTRLRVDTGSINTTTDMNPGRTPRGTLTLAGAAPSSVSRVIMSTLSIRTRRWTRKEYDRLVELGFMRGQISRTTDRQPGGSCPRGLSPAGPRGVSALRLEVPPRTGAEARGERLAARRPDRTDRRRRSAAVGRASPQAPLNPRAAARRPNVRETMMRGAELWRYPVLPLLVATDGAIAALGVDRRRLRPNILVEGVEGLAERAWPGRRLRIGDALIAVEKLRGRCVMTTFDPDTQAQDLSVLKRIVAE